MSRRAAVITDIDHWTHDAEPPALRVRVSVDNNHCHRYAVCQQEAPDVFQLTPDGRLAYDPSPDHRQAEAVRHAARLCPMQAITVEGPRLEPS
jgi:ferredoxin